MAVVPFKLAGPAADQESEERLLQVRGLAACPHWPHCCSAAACPDKPGRLLRLSPLPPLPQLCHITLRFRQRPAASRAARHLREGPRVEWPQDDAEDAAAAAAGAKPDLSNVGLVVWSSSVVLADLLLRRPPMGAWPGVRVLELVGAGGVGGQGGRQGVSRCRACGLQAEGLDQDRACRPNPSLPPRPPPQGAGTGVTGMFLAAAGARAVLTDRPHITHLTRENVAANCAGGGGAAGAPLVVDYSWGEPAAALRGRVAAAAAAAAGGPPDTADAAAAEWLARLAPAHSARADGSEASGPLEFDVIVGADLLYAPEGHAPLLASLRELAAPHTQVRPAAGAGTWGVAAGGRARL
jgi:hypothetical protein